MVTFLSYISNACHSLSGVAERLQHTSQAILQYRSDLLSVPGIQEPILIAKELLSDICSSFAIVTRHPCLNTYDGQFPFTDRQNQQHQFSLNYMVSVLTY